MAPAVVDGSVTRAETPPPRCRQSGGTSPKISGSGSDEWTRSPLSRPRHPPVSRTEAADDFSAAKPRRVSDEAFLSPVQTRISPFAHVGAKDLVLSPGHAGGKENSPLSLAYAQPHPPLTPGPRIPMPTVREHGGFERPQTSSQRSPELSRLMSVMGSAQMNPAEPCEHGFLRSPIPPGLPEPSVRNTFITFESPLRTDRPQSPPKSVPANHLFGSAEPNWWGSASPPPTLLATLPAWPPSTPEPQYTQLTPDMASPLRLSDFLTDLPAVPSMQSFADACVALPPATIQPVPTAGTMPRALVITKLEAPLPHFAATPSGERALSVPEVDAAKQGGDFFQVAVTCAEAVMTNEEGEFIEQPPGAEWSQSWAQMPSSAQPQALCYNDQFQQSRHVQPQVFDLDRMLHPQSQPPCGQEQQFMQQMQCVPHQDQHRHMSCQLQHEMPQPLQQNVAESVQLKPEISHYAQLQPEDGIQHIFEGHEQPMLQQQIPQQQMLQQMQDSVGLSQAPIQIPQLMPQQIYDPMQQLICDQMQQLQHTQQQMQHQEMQYQMEQYMHLQMQQQMQQHMQEQQLREQTQQMINMLQHQLLQAQQPPSHLAAPIVSRAPVKLSELLQLQAMPPAVAPSHSVLGPCSAVLACRSEDAVAAISRSTGAPETAEKWVDEVVVSAPCDSAPFGISILSEVLREMHDAESTSARVSAPHTGRRNRGPRSGGRR